MQIIRVNDPQTEKAFRQFPAKLHKNDPHWLQPSHVLTKNLFSPGKNPFFEHGEAERWLLTNFRGSMIGRIAAFIDRSGETPQGYIGFFECIDHPKAAFELFDQCKDWLARKGVTRMQGPVNLLNRMGQWGLPTGDSSESFYYQSFFENYGFQLWHKQYSFQLEIPTESSIFISALKENAARELAVTTIQMEPLDKKDTSGFVDSLQEIFNDHHQHHPHFTPMDQSAAQNTVQRWLPLLDEKMVFTVFHEQQAVGILISLREKDLLSKRPSLDVLNKLRYLLQHEDDQEDKAIVMLMAVRQEFQGKGLEAAMLAQLSELILPMGISKIEIAGVWDFDAGLQQLAEQQQLITTRVFHTYEYPIAAGVEDVMSGQTGQSQEIRHGRQ